MSASLSTPSVGRYGATGLCGVGHCLNFMHTTEATIRLASVQTTAGFLVGCRGLIAKGQMLTRCARTRLKTIESPRVFDSSRQFVASVLPQRPCGAPSGGVTAARFFEGGA